MTRWTCHSSGGITGIGTDSQQTKYNLPNTLCNTFKKQNQWASFTCLRITSWVTLALLKMLQYHSHSATQKTHLYCPHGYTLHLQHMRTAASPKLSDNVLTGCRFLHELHPYQSSGTAQYSHSAGSAAQIPKASAWRRGRTFYRVCT